MLDQVDFGGMGAVYIVNELQVDDEGALKVMLPSLLQSSKAKQCFLDEIKTSQKLSHPGIIRVYDLSIAAERDLETFTMELIKGITLGRRMGERGGSLPVEETLDILNQLCDALEYAHDFTINRGLKPQNIMVWLDGTIIVLDFGLAKMMTAGRMNKSSMALGIAYYQALNQSVQLLDSRDIPCFIEKLHVKLQIPEKKVLGRGQLI